MPTYVYETIPQRPGEAVERFELQHSMIDPPRERHPVTGQRIRRVITAPGLAVSAKSARPAAAKRVGRGCGCGPGCGCAS